MDYPKVSGISSTYDTANYRYSNNSGSTYYNMFLKIFILYFKKKYLNVKNSMIYIYIYIQNGI